MILLHLTATPRGGLATAGALCILTLATACRREAPAPAEYVGRARVRLVPRHPGLAVEHLAPRAGHGGGRLDHGVRRLRRRDLHGKRRHLPLLPEGRRLLGGHRRPRRCTHRIPGPLHLRGLSAPAIPDRLPAGPLPGARARVGQSHQGRGGPALVLPVPGREGRLPGRAALDRDVAELELHVRAVPLDQPAEGVRGGRRQLRHHLVGDRRLLRGLPRTRQCACGACGQTVGGHGLVARRERPHGVLPR